MPRVEIDKEIKLISASNTQIKFYNRKQPEYMAKRVEGMLKALGIKMRNRDSFHRRGTRSYHHTYFDEGWTLADEACTLTIKSDKASQDSHELIFKFDETMGQSSGIAYLDRREMRLPIDSATKDAFIRDGISPDQLRDLFPQARFSAEDATCFRKEGSINVKRSWIDVEVEEQVYRIVIDRYHFFNSTFDKYSETFTEIEIVSRAFEGTPEQSGEFHPEIRRFANLLCAMIDVEVQAVSKYQRFKDFSVSDGFEEYYFIGFDIVAYSNEHSLKQKQVVQRFHKIIKDEIVRNGFPEDKEPIKISIGDGALIAISSDWLNIRRLINRIRGAVQANNREDAARVIDYRTAIHYGSVFRFTDLNDMMNLAGEGINIVSRILNETRLGQTVLSKQAYKRILDSSPVDRNDFRDLGRHITKHGQELDLVEYLQK